jgi:eukaryotic-like serine/threonine-protein kinase
VVTYAAEHSSSSTAVVIKMLDFKKIQAWKVLELFEREATVLQGLSHPAIPEYIDAFQVEYEGCPYYWTVVRCILP